MKKILLPIIVFFMICLPVSIIASDGIDLSDMSFEELLNLQEMITKKLWESDGWQEVEVPVGVYKVGEEIPAGKWTVSRATDEYTYFRVGNTFEDGEVGWYTVTADLETSTNIIIEDGQYIEVSYFPVVFTPYSVSFSFK